MMRLRPASVIAVLSLLAPAATASAESSWVLWANRKERIAEFATQGQCMDEAKRNIMKFPTVPGHYPESSDTSWSVLAPLLTGGASVFRYDCLPDTVDPRAKGSEQSPRR